MVLHMSIVWFVKTAQTAQVAHLAAAAAHQAAAQVAHLAAAAAAAAQLVHNQSIEDTPTPTPPSPPTPTPPPLHPVAAPAPAPAPAAEDVAVTTSYLSTTQRSQALEEMVVANGEDQDMVEDTVVIPQVDMAAMIVVIPDHTITRVMASMINTRNLVQDAAVTATATTVRRNSGEHEARIN